MKNSCLCVIGFFICNSFLNCCLQVLMPSIGKIFTSFGNSLWCLPGCVLCFVFPVFKQCLFIVCICICFFVLRLLFSHSFSCVFIFFKTTMNVIHVLNLCPTIFSLTFEDSWILHPFLFVSRQSECLIFAGNYGYMPHIFWYSLLQSYHKTLTHMIIFLFFKNMLTIEWEYIWSHNLWCMYLTSLDMSIPMGRGE